MKLELEVTDGMQEELRKIASDNLVEVEDVAKMALADYITARKPKSSFAFPAKRLGEILVSVGTMLSQKTEE